MKDIFNCKAQQFSDKAATGKQIPLNKLKGATHHQIILILRQLFVNFDLDYSHLKNFRDRAKQTTKQPVITRRLGHAESILSPNQTVFIADTIWVTGRN